jgi:hypothetical protein
VLPTAWRQFYEDEGPLPVSSSFDKNAIRIEGCFGIDRVFTLCIAGVLIIIRRRVGAPIARRCKQAILERKAGSPPIRVGAFPGVRRRGFGQGRMRKPESGNSRRTCPTGLPWIGGLFDRIPKILQNPGDFGGCTLPSLMYSIIRFIGSSRWNRGADPELESVWAKIVLQSYPWFFPILNAMKAGESAQKKAEGSSLGRCARGSD